MSKILISGGFGFIGSHLSKNFIDNGHDVYIFDQNIHYFPLDKNANKSIDYKKKNLINKANIIFGSSLDFAFLKNTIENIQPEYIINLGALPLAKKAIQNPSDAFDSIVQTAKNFMEILKDINFLKKYVHVSSSMVYGNFEKDKVVETDQKDPIEIYGSMKLASENIVTGYSRIFKINSNIVRPSAVYGPCDMNYRIVQKIMDNCFKKKSVTLNNAKNNYLDFTYVKDVAEAIKCVTFCDTKKVETFNVTYGGARSLFELSNIFLKYFPNQEFIFNNENNFYPKRGTLDITKTKKMTDYQPEYNLEKGIKEYYDFFLKYIN